MVRQRGWQGRKGGPQHLPLPAHLRRDDLPLSTHLLSAPLAPAATPPTCRVPAAGTEGWNGWWPRPAWIKGEGRTRRGRRSSGGKARGRREPRGPAAGAGREGLPTIGRLIDHICACPKRRVTRRLAFGWPLVPLVNMREARSPGVEGCGCQADSARSPSARSWSKVSCTCVTRAGEGGDAAACATLPAQPRGG